MRKFFSVLAAICYLPLACNNDNSEPAKSARSYQMGFQNSAPRYDDFNLILECLNLWSTRADAAIISEEVPWAALLSGTKASTYITDHYKGLVEYYRSKDFTLWIYVDPQNGLDRSSDALELKAANRSISEPSIQQLYRNYVVTMDSMFHPEHFGLALETNLIRGAASAAIYNGVKQAANSAVFDLKSRNSKAKLSVSIQVDHAWGKLGGGTYEGIAKDFVDFPFVEELGLSSYPYFGFKSPSDIPSNYYSRLMESNPLPVFISEGGWTSSSVSTSTINFMSSVEIQKNYLSRQEGLLDGVKAIAWFQLVFTDIDIASLPANVPANIGYFAYLGLVDKDLQPKPALSVWDGIFSRTLK